MNQRTETCRKIITTCVILHNLIRLRYPASHNLVVCVDQGHEDNGAEAPVVSVHRANIPRTGDRHMLAIQSTTAVWKLSSLLKLLSNGVLAFDNELVLLFIFQGRGIPRRRRKPRSIWVRK
jgi:hypothetical protein